MPRSAPAVRRSSAPARSAASRSRSRRTSRTRRCASSRSSTSTRRSVCSAGSASSPARRAPSSTRASSRDRSGTSATSSSAGPTRRARSRSTRWTRPRSTTRACRSARSCGRGSSRTPGTRRRRSSCRPSRRSRRRRSPRSRPPRRSPPRPQPLHRRPPRPQQPPHRRSPPRLRPRPRPPPTSRARPRRSEAPPMKLNSGRIALWFIATVLVGAFLVYMTTEVIQPALHPLAERPPAGVPDVIFYVLAALTIAGAAGVTLSRNILYSSVGLLMALLGAGSLYVFLSADFVAVLLFISVAPVLLAVVSLTPWPAVASAPLAPTTEAIGNGFLTRWLLPFEVASLVLLATLVGAVVIARKEIKAD